MGWSLVSRICDEGKAGFTYPHEALKIKEPALALRRPEFNKRVG